MKELSSISDADNVFGCDPKMTIVTVACGYQIRQHRQLNNLIKSILLFTNCPLIRIIVFVDKHTLQTVLPDTDSVIYLDSDVLLVAPIEKLWNQFRNMTTFQLAAIAPEPNSVVFKWYGLKTELPYVPPAGAYLTARTRGVPEFAPVLTDGVVCLLATLHRLAASSG